MGHEYAASDNQDLAEPGYDTPNQNASEGHALGQAKHDNGDCGKEARDITREGVSLEVPDPGEFYEATPERRAEMVVARSWRGLLPAPEDFNQYPPEVQAEIVRWAQQAIAQQQQITDSAVAMDKADSDRLDQLVIMEERERRFGQVATVILDVAILGGSLYAASINQPWVAAALAGVLGGINAFSIFGKPGGKTDAEHEDDRLTND